ncbi:MAG TPA: hypothetical protein VN329_13425 [Roseomonas sp.]|nr:hypothetical protein [Roseomonas sp.]
MSPTATPASLKRLAFAEFQSAVMPHLTQFMKDNADAFAGKTFDPATAIADMFKLVQGQYAISLIPVPAPPPPTELAVGMSSACITMIVTSSIDCAMIVLQAIGVPENVAKICGQTIVAEAGPEALSGLEQSIKDIEAATSNPSKALKIFTLFGEIYKITGIRQILGALEPHMAWYEWVLMAVIIIAQVTAWVATDGVGAVAEILIFGALLIQTGVDVATTCKDCGWL